jgi:hypothetical protein
MNNSTATRYLTFGETGDSGAVVYGPGLGNGFFGVINDSSNRGPLRVTLEGRNTSTITALNLNSRWTHIYNGSTDINLIHLILSVQHMS